MQVLHGRRQLARSEHRVQHGIQAIFLLARDEYRLQNVVSEKVEPVIESPLRLVVFDVELLVFAKRLHDVERHQ